MHEWRANDLGARQTMVSNEDTILNDWEGRPCDQSAWRS